MNDTVNKTAHPLGLSRDVVGIFKNGLGLFAHFIDLVAVEIRLAGFSLVMIIAVAIGIVLLTMSAWLLLMSSIAFAMIATGYGWGSALLALAGLNILAIIPLIYTAISLSRNLLFRFTRQQAKDLIATGENHHETT